MTAVSSVQRLAKTYRGPVSDQSNTRPAPGPEIPGNTLG